MKKKLLTVALLMGTWVASSQVGIGTLNPDKSAQLDVVASDKGILIPRVSLTSVTDAVTISNGNVESLLVYNTSNNEGISPGYYYWYEGEWRKLLTPIDVSTDVLTVLNFEAITNTLTYLDENGLLHNFLLNNTKNDTIILNGTVLTITDTDGDQYTVDLASLDTNTTNTSLVLDAQNQLKLTDSSTNVLTADLSSLVNTTKVNAGTNVTVTGNGSVLTPYVVNSNNTTNTSFTLDQTTNILTLVDSDNNIITIDLSTLAKNTTITNVSFDSVTNNLTVTDSENNTKIVDISGVLKAKNGLHV